MGRLNRPAKPGYTYAHPSETSARDLTPNLMEEAFTSGGSDIERIRRGLDSTARSAPNRLRQQEAAGRAALRTMGRMGMAGQAAASGVALGEAIDKRYPAVGEAAEKLIEKSGVGALARRGAVPPGRVELTDDAKQRIEDEAATQDVIRARKKVAEERGEEYARGGFVKKADGIARRGKTRGRIV